MYHTGAKALTSNPDELPDELKGNLPSVAEIEAELSGSEDTEAGKHLPGGA